MVYVAYLYKYSDSIMWNKQYVLEFRANKDT